MKIHEKAILHFLFCNEHAVESVKVSRNNFKHQVATGALKVSDSSLNAHYYTVTKLGYINIQHGNTQMNLH